MEIKKKNSGKKEMREMSWNSSHNKKKKKEKKNPYLSHLTVIVATLPEVGTVMLFITRRRV